MKQFLLFNEQGSCYKCLCEFFNIFWCFRFENWYDNSVSINSIFIDKIDSPNSNIDNYRLLTPNAFIDFYRISKKLIDFYRLLSNVIGYRCYRLTTPGSLRGSKWRSCFWTKRDWSWKSCYGNSTKGVILFLLWWTIMVPSFKNTALIFLEILFFSAFYNF